MKRRSNTKKNPPHDPFELYLDEGISGKELATILSRAGLRVFVYEKLLKRNKKIQDGDVIAACLKAGYILVTKDESMQADWITDIIRLKARVLVICDSHGTATHWGAAIIAAEIYWTRHLLSHPTGPLVIEINRQGRVQAKEENHLQKRWQDLTTARIVRSKQRMVTAHRNDGTNN